MSYADIKPLLAEARLERDLGIRVPDPKRMKIFRDVGFDVVEAEVGARAMHLGRSPGFSEVAEALALEKGSVLTEGVRKLIAEGQGRVEMYAAQRPKPEIWGSRQRMPVTEPAAGGTNGGRVAEGGRRASGRKSPWGSDLGPRVVESPKLVDFTAVGLSETEAEKARAGLAEGKFISYEDACLSVAYGAGSKSLREDEMRTRARRFVDGRAR